MTRPLLAVLRAAEDVTADCGHELREGDEFVRVTELVSTDAGAADAVQVLCRACAAARYRFQLSPGRAW